MGQFGIGQAVRRKEDQRLITGAGSFTDDVHLANEVHAVFLRSPHAHAKILSLDASSARAMPGVLGIFTGEDVAHAGLAPIRCALPLKNRDGSDYANPGRPRLAVNRVRHVGDPIAMVIAESLHEARDAAEAVAVEYEILPAVIDPRRALDPKAPLIDEMTQCNLALDWGLGDEKAVEQAFAAAHRIVRMDLAINRIVIASMEARGVVATYDAKSERYTIRMGTQGVVAMRRSLANGLGVAPERIRVLTGDVGGSFGMKGMDFPENILVPWAAKQLGRPVRWISERQEAFLSDTQGREVQVHAEMALDADHRFLAIRVSNYANMGGYLSFFSLGIPTFAGARLLTGAYRIPCAYFHSRSVRTNTVWVDAYRGAGRPECAYMVERLVEQAGRETGLGPIEIRKRNFVPASAMPYATPMGVTYDSGDFAAVFETALKAADWQGAPARKAEAKARGRLLGIGLCYYLEVTAPGPQEAADIRFREDGRMSVIIGSGPTGQGHETPLAQLLEDRLGVPFDRIDFEFGDSDQLAMGSGTGGAKTLMLAGTAIFDAADKIIAKGIKLASHVLEAAESDIVFEDGIFRVSGTDIAIPILDLAARVRSTGERLDEIGKSTTDRNTFPNGCHVAEIEIDSETGIVEVKRYSVVDDFGVVVNPMIVKGQAHGGIAQGIGQVLMENAAYDPDNGQLLAGSFNDYAMPVASDFPRFELDFKNTPCRTNVLGVKGCGEAGSVGALAAVMNAVNDALHDAGAASIDMPATPRRVWEALRQLPLLS